MSTRAPGDRAHGHAGERPQAPTRVPARAWLTVLKRTGKEFQADSLTDLAAALTYYGVLAIFPALIALVSILGLIGRSATQPMIQNLDQLAPWPARQIFSSAIANLQNGRGTAGVLFIVGLAGAIWSASGYVAAFMRASNVVYDISEGRPAWKTIPIRVGVTVLLLILVTVSAVAVVVTGGLAGQVGKLLGIGGSAVTVWDIAKWPVLLVIVSLMFSLLYWAAPNVKQPGFRWLSPGGVFAVVLWVLASALFALYVSGFSSYNKTYGAIAGVVVFLVWLWISNVALLLGCELNAELERERRIEGGAPVEQEPYVEPRDEPKHQGAV